MGVGGFCPCCPCRAKDYVNDEAAIETLESSIVTNPNPIKGTVFQPNCKDGSEVDEFTSFEVNYEKLNDNKANEDTFFEGNFGLFENNN